MNPGLMYLLVWTERLFPCEKEMYEIKKIVKLKNKKTKTPHNWQRIWENGESSWKQTIPSIQNVRGISAKDFMLISKTLNYTNRDKELLIVITLL